ncbi:MAG: hypothetical protein U5K99_07920 [Anaerolineales bacterium]|nr:hypothetical protein [Anaerolineales bacterium]
MFTRKSIWWIRVFLTVVITGGCAAGWGSGSGQTQQPTAEPSQTADLDPTDTPAPPTLTPEPTAEQQAHLQVSPVKATPGARVQLSLTGFHPEARLDLGAGRVNSEYDLISEVVTDQDGKLETTVRVPDYAQPGNTWVFAAAAPEKGIKVLSNEIEIIEGEGPNLSVSPQIIGVGEEVEVSAGGFPPEADVDLGIGRLNSEYDIIDRQRTDSAGSMQAVLTVPGFVEEGDQWVIVAAADEGRIKAVSQPLEIKE